MARLPDNGIGSRFPITKLTHCSTSHALTIHDFAAEARAPRVASDVNRQVLPFVQSIEDEGNCLDGLLADDRPMRWAVCQPRTRFAETMKRSCPAGRNPGPAVRPLERERRLAQGRLHHQDLDADVSAVIQAAGD